MDAAVLVLLFAIVDINFIGLFSNIFLRHPWLAAIREPKIFSIHMREIKSNCFSVDRKNVTITHAQTYFDSHIVLTKSYLLLGKRLFTYHYKIRLKDIRSIEHEVVLKWRHKLKLEIACKGGECELLITYHALTKKTHSRFYCLIKELESAEHSAHSPTL